MVQAEPAMRQSKEKKKRNRGYAARLGWRRANLGVGPLRDRDGKPLPYPKPFFWFKEER